MVRRAGDPPGRRVITSEPSVSKARSVSTSMRVLEFGAVLPLL